MRGKVAKYLRSRAAGATGNAPRRYVLHSNGLKANGKARSGSIRLDPSCARARYQQLKKEHRHG